MSPTSRRELASPRPRIDAPTLPFGQDSLSTYVKGDVGVACRQVRDVLEARLPRATRVGGAGAGNETALWCIGWIQNRGRVGHFALERIVGDDVQRPVVGMIANRNLVVLGDRGGRHVDNGRWNHARHSKHDACNGERATRHGSLRSTSACTSMPPRGRWVSETFT